MKLTETAVTETSVQMHFEDEEVAEAWIDFEVPLQALKNYS